MATPRRPSRPSSASAKRRPPPEDEVPEGEEGELEEAAAKPQGPSVTMMVGLGAGLVFAILLAMLVFSKRGFLIEIENLSENPLQKVVVKVNGQAAVLGDLRPNEISGAQMKCSPGNDIEVEYVVPHRGAFVKRLPKVDKEGNVLQLDFAEYRGRCRVRLKPEGIDEISY